MDRSIDIGLDNPVWASLTTTQAHLGNGDAFARRYHPDVAPFAALASDTPAAYQALRKLLSAHEQVALLSTGPIGQVDALQRTHVGIVHQMVARHLEAGTTDTKDMIQLSRADAKDMLDLAQKTKPGPFSTRTGEMGNYIGIRDQGRLIAMAGERMRLDGYVEISAVCVDEEWRGKGLAGRLVKTLGRQIAQRGNAPFLHVFSDNLSAIGLYERLGFELRRTFHLSRIGCVEQGKGGGL